MANLVNCLWFAKLKPSKLVVTVHKPIGRSIRSPNFFCQMLRKSKFTKFYPCQLFLLYGTSKTKHHEAPGVLQPQTPCFRNSLLGLWPPPSRSAPEKPSNVNNLVQYGTADYLQKIGGWLWAWYILNSHIQGISWV